MRRPVPLLLVLLLTVSAAAPAAGQTASEGDGWSEGEVVLDGRGYGHGVGMSQYGAYALARDGWSHEEILHHYYTGIELGQHDLSETRLRLGLTANADTWQLDNAPDSAAPIEASLPDGVEDPLEAEPGQTLEITRAAQDGEQGEARCELAVEDQTRSGPCDGLTVEGLTPGETPTVVDLPREGAHDLELARGTLELVEAKDGDALHLRALIDLEEYLYGLAEVPSGWPTEVLEAQAVAGRTYAVRRLAAGGASSCSCDVTTTTGTQHYTGWRKESEPGYGHRWVSAVDATAREVATYDGALINAVYHSSSPGRTEDSGDIWSASLPYLQPVDDEHAHREGLNNSAGTWQVTVDYDDFVSKLDGLDELHAAEVESRMASENPAVYRFSGERDGEESVVLLHTDDDLRPMFALNSHGIHRIELTLPEIFTDVDISHPFDDEIAWLVDQQVTDGYDDGSFQPGRDVTRQAAAAFLHRLEGEPAPGGAAPFSDVDDEHQFHDAIAWASEQGIVEGYGDDTFRPGEPVARQAMSAFLHRYRDEPTPAGDPDFDDVESDHPFADAIAWMDEQAITTGFDDGTFRPGGTMTRQAAAAFLHRLEVEQ